MERPDTVGEPTPRSAKKHLRELRLLRSRVTELESQLGGESHLESRLGHAQRGLGATRSAADLLAPNRDALAVSLSLPGLPGLVLPRQVQDAGLLPAGTPRRPRKPARHTPADAPAPAPRGSAGAGQPVTRQQVMRQASMRRRPDDGDFSSQLLGATETRFMEKFGICVSEIMHIPAPLQRLVYEEVLHSTDARQVHRLIAGNDAEACDAVFELEKKGGSSCRLAVSEFRKTIIRLFRDRLPAANLRPRPTTRESMSRGNSRGKSRGEARRVHADETKSRTTTPVAAARPTADDAAARRTADPPRLALPPLTGPFAADAFAADAFAADAFAADARGLAAFSKALLVFSKAAPAPAAKASALVHASPVRLRPRVLRQETGLEAKAPARPFEGVCVAAEPPTAVSHAPGRIPNSDAFAKSRYKAPTPTGSVPVLDAVSSYLEKRCLDAAVAGPRPVARQEVVAISVLVGRGKYNPIHKMHLRHFVIARQYLETHTRYAVLGGLLLPKHGTEVRQRCRTQPRTIIPPRHRLGLTRAAVGARAWLTVDSWEVTRRRILDYLSTLEHVRSLFSDRAAAVKMVYLVAPDDLPKLNLEELRDAGHLCISICRPQQFERLLAQMGTRWMGVAMVVEDSALLGADLESVTAAKVRSALAKSGDVSSVEASLPCGVCDYMLRHRIAEKMAGSELWSRWDKDLDDGEGAADRGYRSNPKKIVYESSTHIKS
ncbi:hypothetical protein M885DRAFT_562956 [Pelagophyceae sp. CCMP2097]|nr:hypothetical protein M885DRAFT_562956 [Pelagophyceae sp. CCMP2097]